MKKGFSGSTVPSRSFTCAEAGCEMRLSIAKPLNSIQKRSMISSSQGFGSGVTIGNDLF